MAVPLVIPFLASPVTALLGGLGVGYLGGSWSSNGWVKALFWIIVLALVYSVMKKTGVFK